MNEIYIFGYFSTTVIKLIIAIILIVGCNIIVILPTDKIIERLRIKRLSRIFNHYHKNKS